MRDAYCSRIVNTSCKSYCLKQVLWIAVCQAQVATGSKVMAVGIGIKDTFEEEGGKDDFNDEVVDGLHRQNQ